MVLVTAKDTNITSCVINSNTKIIANSAFEDCSSLKTVTFEADSKLTSIDSYAFRDCSSLESIEIPNSVTGIGYFAFEDCSSLESIEIPNSVTSIGSFAFEDCSSLKTVTFEADSKLTSIGSYAFYECNSLQYNIYDNGLYLGNSENKYLVLVKAKDTNITSCVINSNTKIIANSAFEDCSSLKTVTFEADSKLISIGSEAFEGCSNLESITIPSSVTSIGEYAFEYCDSLASITVESGNTVYHSAGNCLIATASKTLILGCKNSVIPTDGSVTRIGSSAFFYCSSLESIEIPNSVTSIGSFAFEDCSSLKTVTFEADSKLISIGYFAFEGCSSLESIEIPNSVTSIGYFAFEGCSSLTSVTFENTVGWKASLISIDSSDLANTATAATYLKSTYDDSTWTRSDN